MDRQVLVCGNRWRPASAGARVVPIALACNVSMATPGEYQVNFTVTNSAGLTAFVTRTLRVKAVCPSGESLCDDKVR
jgi:hypothetical protein